MEPECLETCYAVKVSNGKSPLCIEKQYCIIIKTYVRWVTEYFFQWMGARFDIL